MELIKRKKDVVYTFPFCFLLLEFVFGMYFNNILFYTEYYKYTTSFDEILAILLLFGSTIYAIQTKREFFNKEIRIVIGILLFYVLYSLFIKSNVPVAIFSDLLVTAKPFIGYFLIGYLAFTLNESQKVILKKVSLFLFAISFIIVCFGFLNGLMYTFTYFYGHPTYYGSAVILVAFTYLYCSDVKNKRDVFIFVFMLTFSLLSARSKIYGFYAAAMFLVVFFRENIELKLSVRTLFVLLMTILVAIYFAWPKINFYFFSDANTEFIARTMMYLTSVDLFVDYFPFGSGLASFASFYSGEYYSHIYIDYGLDNIWGLVEGDTAFAADAFYPSLAQFGVVGALLFFYFFGRIIGLANKLNKRTEDRTSYLIIILLIILLAIQSVAETMFTSNKGFYLMILLSLSMNQLKQDVKK